MKLFRAQIDWPLLTVPARSPLNVTGPTEIEPEAATLKSLVLKSRMTLFGPLGMVIGVAERSSAGGVEVSAFRSIAPLMPTEMLLAASVMPRSEERRVGKECRSR